MPLTAVTADNTAVIVSQNLLSWICLVFSVSNYSAKNSSIAKYNQVDSTFIDSLSVNTSY